MSWEKLKIINRPWTKLMRFFCFFAICFLFSCGQDRAYLNLTPVPDAEAVGVFHQIKKGQTLISICRDYKANLQEVAEINGITNPDLLQVGQTVFIPDIDENLSPKTAKKENIRQWNGKFIWPVNGVLTSRFGIRNSRRHDGIDIGAQEGTPIVAAADGDVLYAGDQKRGYGILVILRHADNMITVYAHNQMNLVAEGDFVKRGQVIAKVGKTGRASGPHLHFEIRSKTRPRNPLFFLPKE
jgi:murein DD-endopeptidase MepM/ murein hydrolase activator NlpD